MKKFKNKNFNCICCDSIIEPLEPIINKIPYEQWMWNNGTVQKITMPYGSELDGNIYYIAICDNCIKEKEKNKSILLINNLYEKYIK